MATTERRFRERGSARMTIQTRAEGGKTLVGYAAVFYRAEDPGTEFEIWSDFVERISPGAFDRALKERDDARALFNHDPANVLGRVGAGTCRLSVDEVGLRYEVDLPDTQIGRDVAVSVERGDVTGSSFAFVPEVVVWIEEITDGKSREIRDIRSVRLVDVGPVTYPAYQGTTTALRSADVEVIKTEHSAFRGERRTAADRVNVRADLVKMGLTTPPRPA